MNRVGKTAVRRRRQGVWLSTCAMATALAVAPHAARAQAFQGSAFFEAGSGVVSTGTGTTTITLRSAESVIDWIPSDSAGVGTIDFLPSGSTATFRSPTDFTVLNRILPGDDTRMVALDGTVNSQIVSTVTTTGGNVWFYTPAGFVIGSDATMNVGGLILTTDDVVYGAKNTGGTDLYGPGNKVMFRGAAGSTGLIDVQEGARLNAVGTASYIAMVAPRIQQAGTVSADRSVGYIAAEQADLTINAGLFNISILAGTTDPNGIVHTGTTTGSASTSGFDAKTISFVALPKATALTMLLSGSIGYAPAADAFNDGSAVVLSSGYATDQPTAEVAGSLGNILINDASFTNGTSAFASGKINIRATNGPVSFAGYSSLYAQDAIAITLGADEQLTTGNGFTLSSARGGNGGMIDISLGDQASLTAAGYIDLVAYNTATPFASTASANANGGKVTVDVNGGTLSATGIYAETDAYGPYDPLTARSATGGAISFTARNGGILSAGSLSASAEAYGGDSDTAGGDATGGSISLISDNGALNLGSVELYAEAFGADGSGTSGAATGGSATVSLNGGTYAWDGLGIYTDAYAGYSDGSQGNAATGGAITLSLANGANLSASDDIYLSANGLATIDGPPDSNATGGAITVDIGSGTSLAFTTLSAYAEAGIDLSIFEGVTPTGTPDVTGGSITLSADGEVAGLSMALLADASELGATTLTGTATGGAVSLLVGNGGSVTLDGGAPATTLELNASGLGAYGGSGGKAVGGSASLSIADGAVDVTGAISVDASGRWNQDSLFYASGPEPLTGFDAQGGAASVELLTGTAGTASLSADSLVVDASGDASTPTFDVVDGGEGMPPGTYGGPISGNGGDGVGGNAGLSIAAGLLDIGDVDVKAAGLGGSSAGSSLATPYQSGNGTGGAVIVGVTGGTSTIDNLTVEADGTGGGGGPGAQPGQLAALAGDGFGGTALLTIGDGGLTATSLQIESIGFGGFGSDFAGSGAATDGGDGTGGTAGLSFLSGATGQLTSSDVLILAPGQGGTGGFTDGGTDGNGGNGVGGTSIAQFADGAFSLGSLTLGADGGGGKGVIGGRGSGGTSSFALTDTTGPAGARSLGPLSLFANGIAGAGGSSATDAGSIALTAAVAAGASLTIGGDLTVEAKGTDAAAGNGFSATLSGGPLTVSGNASITTARDAEITANRPFNVTGDLTVSSRSLTETGTTVVGGATAITAPQGISIDTIRSGGTTGLSAINGAIAVADLASTGAVTALARSIDVADGGPLTFASAQATAGDLAISTGGDLVLQSASATGAMNLASTGGAVSGTGAITSGGAFAASGRDGVSFGTLTSGGTTSLTSAAGPVSVSGLQSAGAVSASGASVAITSTGALLFATANATAGDLTLNALSLTATGPLSATGNVLVDAANGITVGALTSGGTTRLTSDGAIAATDLRSAGLVTVSGASIDIASGAGLTFDTAAATAGNLVISTALGLSANGALSATGDVALTGTGGLTAGTVTSGGTTALGAPNGAISVAALNSPGAVTASGRSVAIASTGPLTFASAEATAGDLSLTALNLTATGPLSATGDVLIDAANGITVDSLTSGGTTGLTSDGAITIDSLTSAGLVSAIGGSIDIASPGALRFGASQATAGDLTLDALSLTATGPLAATGNVLIDAANGITVGALSSGGTTALTAASGSVAATDLRSTGAVTAAGGSIDLSSGAGLTFDTATATTGNLAISTALGLTANGALSATGDVALTGTGGITAGTVTSGGATALGAPNGAIAVADLQSPGVVSASGQSISIASTDALAFSGAEATAGDLSLTALDLTASGPLSATGNVLVDAANGIAVGTLTSGGTTGLTSDGAIGVGSLTSAGLVTAIGKSIAITSPGALSFADAQATGGDLAISTQGDLGLADASASGGLTLSSTSGHVATSGTLSSGGNTALSGQLGVAAQTLASGGTTDLEADGGGISVADLTSPGAVTANGASVTIGSSGGLAFAAANATAGDLALTTAADLVLPDASATGAMTLTSTGGGVTANSLTAGSSFSANGATGLDFAAAQSGGTTSLVSSGGDVTVTDLTSVGAVSATGESVTIGSTGELAFAGATATAGNLLLSALDLRASGLLSATGSVGIDAANGISLASLTSGGTTGLAATNGAIVATDLRSANAVTALGRSVAISSGAGLTFGNLHATAGDLSVNAVGDITLFAGEGRDAIQAVGAASLISSGGAVVSERSIIAGGSATLQGPDGVTIPFLQSGATTLLQAGPSAAVDVDTLISAGDVSVTGGDVDIGGSGPLTFTVADARNTMAITTSGDLAFASANAGNDLTLESTNGSLTASGDLRGRSTRLTATGDIAIVGDLTARGGLTVNAGGAFTTEGAASSGDADIAAVKGISMASLTASDSVLLRANAGTVQIGDLRTDAEVTANGQAIDISSGAGLSFDQASASDGNLSISTQLDLTTGALTAASGDVSLNSTDGDLHATDDIEGLDLFFSAGGDVRVDSSLEATDLLQIRAGGAFVLNGAAKANSISVSSGDIDLTPDSQLGERGATEAITLMTNDPTSPLFIGGGAHEGSYSLDNAEAGRLFADDSIVIGSSAGEGVGDGDISIGDLTLSYGAEGNLGSGGVLSILTNGTVTVNGAVQLTTSAADDTFEIDPSLINVVAGQGSIAMLSDAGSPQGTLSLTADRIVVATPETFDAIDGLTDLAGISDALAKPGAAGPEGGYLQAGTIEANVDEAFLVQNSGASDAFADRRGFNANEVDINTGSTDTLIAINGVILQDGDPVTGLDTAPLVTINDAAATAGGQFQPLSTINGCAIGADCALPPPPPPPPPPSEPPVTNPTDDELTQPLEQGNGDQGNQVFTDALFSLAGTTPLITPPLVDEPITGVGNDDLWVSGCSGGNADECSDKKEGDE